MENNFKKGPLLDLTGCYDICAAHQLKDPSWSDQKNREVFGHCVDLHGHQYKLEVTLTGNLDVQTGMLINGYAMDALVREHVLAIMDHKFLNDLDFFKEHLPTAEWIAVWIFKLLDSVFPSPLKLKRVRIFETPNLYAEYTG